MIVNVTAQHKQLHDLLLPFVDKSHSDDCPICAAETQETVVSETDTDIQAKIDEAVAAALAPIEAERDELASKLAQRDTDDEVASLTAEKAALQTELDERVAELTAARSEHDKLIEFLEAEQARIDAEAAVKAVRAERVAEVEGLAIFDEKHIEASADRWAAQSEDEWAAQSDEFKAIAAKLGATGADPVTPVVEPTSPVIVATELPSQVNPSVEDSQIVHSNRQSLNPLGL